MSFELEPHGERVKLTVVTDNFAPGSRMAELIGGSWPMVLSSLRTLLETADTRPATAA